jgi:S1-C subfamily serine protease
MVLPSTPRNVALESQWKPGIAKLVILSVLYASYLGAAVAQSGSDMQGIPTLAPMLERVTPAVVNIASAGRIPVEQNPLFNAPFFRDFFGVPGQPLERKTQSLGSGVIVDAERGLILTNAHVIANADQITVKLGDGRSYEAELVGTDAETDIGVVKITAERLTDVPMADSSQLRVGDSVIAIGNPFGLTQTVTSGIVSTLGRSGLGIEGYEDFIQTDAAIQHGAPGDGATGEAWKSATRLPRDPVARSRPHMQARSPIRGSAVRHLSRYRGMRWPTVRCKASGCARWNATAGHGPMDCGRETSSPR